MSGDDSFKLTQQQLDAFKEDGFIIVKAGTIFNKEEIENFKQWSKDVEEWEETPGKWMKYYETSSVDGSRILQRVENFFMYHEGLNKMFNGGKVLSIISQLFGEQAVLYKEKINFKYPGGTGFKPHQDHAAGWWRYGHTLHISMLATIDECHEKNGALELVRGWHKKGLLSPEYTELPDELCQTLTWERADMEPGDMAFFDSFVPHRSAPNTSTAPRRVLYSTYNKLSEGDYCQKYYADKRETFPPDCERKPGVKYEYKI